MHFMWVNVLVICCGLRGVVAEHSDGYIGCYTRMSSDLKTSFSNNSGRICKDFCFPQNRYAATSLLYCLCMERLNGEQKQNCNFDCPDQTIAGETCGGSEEMTVFDAQKTTTTHSTTTTSTTSSTLKPSTTPGVTSTVNSFSVKTHSTTNPIVSTDETTKYFSNGATTESISGKGDGALLPKFVKIIIIVGILIVLVNIAVCAVLLARRLRRKRLKRSRTRAGPQDAYVGHCGEGGVTSGQDVLETEYETTTTTCRPKPPHSSAEDDYSRLKMPGGRFEDPTYSHVRDNQLGACAVLEGEYSYLGRTEGGNKWTCNEKSNTAANDYDSVQFNKPMKVRLVRRAGLQTGVSNDDVYDKLQNKF